MHQHGLNLVICSMPYRHGLRPIGARRIELADSRVGPLRGQCQGPVFARFKRNAP